MVLIFSSNSQQIETLYVTLKKHYVVFQPQNNVSELI